jgi:hypothetical protein
MMIVVPFSAASKNMRNTEAAVDASSAEVGSSATISEGSATRAYAIARALFEVRASRGAGGKSRAGRESALKA